MGAIQCGQVWVGAEWDPRAGKQLDPDPVTGAPRYEGGPLFSMSMPWDIVCDMNNRSADDHRWLIRRQLMNRWDLIATYAPNWETDRDQADIRNEILGAGDDAWAWMTERNQYNTTVGQTRFGKSPDTVAVYTFFHAKTPALPQGRWALFLNGRTLLAPPSPLPYKELPLVPVMAGEWLDTCFGVSPIHLILAMQSIVDQLLSAIATNNLNLARQIIVMDKDEKDFDVSQMTEGMSVFFVGKDAAGNLAVPQALNLVRSSPETLQLIEMLEQGMNTLTGVNSVSRGEGAEGTKLSGAAMALIDAMTLRVSSPLQASYTRCVEKIGNLYLSNLKMYAESPRLALIAGKSRKYAAQEFKSTDFESIDRVVVSAGNANTRSPAFRLQMAQDFLQRGLITPQQYMEIAETGQLDSAEETEDAFAAGIRAENEQLRDRKSPRRARLRQPSSAYQRAFGTLG